MAVHDNDSILLQKLRIGDEKSFRRVYQKYHTPLYSTALKYLRCRERAEDAVHDVFVKLWNSRTSLEASGSLRGFLFTTLKNHVLDIIRRKKRRLKRDIQLTYEKKINSGKAENVVILSQYREAYQSAIEQLPAKRREVFTLRLEEGLTNAEVAEYLNISIHTVKSQYYKASKFIRAHVKEHSDIKTGS